MQPVLSLRGISKGFPGVKALDGLQTHQKVQRRYNALAEADAEAFGILSALWKLPEDHPERVADWEVAVRAAINAPLAMCRLCRNASELLAGLPGRTNHRHSHSARRRQLLL